MAHLTRMLKAKYTMTAETTKEAAMLIQIFDCARI